MKWKVNILKTNSLLPKQNSENMLCSPRKNFLKNLRRNIQNLSFAKFNQENVYGIFNILKEHSGQYSVLI